ncbi:MAG: hypothetical protein PGN13_11050 [Patulibacter minatonensis]
MQAGVVDVLARRDRARALAALGQVEQAALGTRTELRALRAVLGTPEAAATTGAGAFCRTTLERIVGEAQLAGHPVLAYIDRHVDELAAEQRATIVRITQEALTNARKHAGRAPTALEIVVRDDAVRLEVRNAAAADGPALSAGAGLGLRGMSERAQAVGGRLDAGPSGGGWIVRAELPRPEFAAVV